LIEDEQVMGNSDRMIFYAKEMLADLTMKPKNTLDPFIICKLDLHTINNFNFPKVPITLNKYVAERLGMIGAQYLLEVEKKSIFGLQRSKADNTAFTSGIS
jgi:hypothetical protein